MALCAVNVLLERFLDRSYVSTSRSLIIVTLALVIATTRYNYVDLDRENNNLLNKVVREGIDRTPTWFRKYVCEDRDGSSRVHH